MRFGCEVGTKKVSLHRQAGRPLRPSPLRRTPLRRHSPSHPCNPSTPHPSHPLLSSPHPLALLSFLGRSITLHPKWLQQVVPHWSNAVHVTVINHGPAKLGVISHKGSLSHFLPSLSLSLSLPPQPVTPITFILFLNSLSPHTKHPILEFRHSN